MNQINININNNELLIKKFSQKYYNIEIKKDKLDLGRKKIEKKDWKICAKLNLKI